MKSTPNFGVLFVFYAIQVCSSVLKSMMEKEMSI